MKANKQILFNALRNVFLLLSPFLLGMLLSCSLVVVEEETPVLIVPDISQFQITTASVIGSADVANFYYNQKTEASAEKFYLKVNDSVKFYLNVRDEESKDELLGLDVTLSGNGLAGYTNAKIYKEEDTQPSVCATPLVDGQLYLLNDAGVCKTEIIFPEIRTYKIGFSVSKDGTSVSRDVEIEVLDTEDGTAEKPFTLFAMEHLESIGSATGFSNGFTTGHTRDESLGFHYRVIKDLDGAGKYDETGGTYFLPIADEVDMGSPFSGEINACREYNADATVLCQEGIYAIKNLRIELDAGVYQDGVALIRSTAINAVIRNFRLENIEFDVTPSQYKGGETACVIADNKGNVENVHVEGCILYGFNDYGLFVARNGGSIKASSVEESILFGYIENGEPKYGDSNIAGFVSINSEVAKISQSFVSNILLNSADEKNTAGFVASNSGTIEHSYAEEVYIFGGEKDPSITATKAGFVGENTATGTIRHAFSEIYMGYVAERFDTSYESEDIIIYRFFNENGFLNNGGKPEAPPNKSENAGFVYSNLGSISNVYAVGAILGAIDSGNTNIGTCGMVCENSGSINNAYTIVKIYHARATRAPKTGGNLNIGNFFFNDSTGLTSMASNLFASELVLEDTYAFIGDEAVLARRVRVKIVDSAGNFTKPTGYNDAVVTQPGTNEYVHGSDALRKITTVDAMVETKTLADLKLAATFSGWDANSWSFGGGTYPRLKLNLDTGTPPNQQSAFRRAEAAWEFDPTPSPTN